VVMVERGRDSVLVVVKKKNLENFNLFSFSLNHPISFVLFLAVGGW
jgi:hypothetical protein